MLPQVVFLKIANHKSEANIKKVGVVAENTITAQPNWPWSILAKSEANATTVVVAKSDHQQ